MIKSHDYKNSSNINTDDMKNSDVNSTKTIITLIIMILAPIMIKEPIMTLMLIIKIIVTIILITMIIPIVLTDIAVTRMTEITSNKSLKNQK